MKRFRRLAMCAAVAACSMSRGAAAQNASTKPPRDLGIVFVYVGPDEEKETSGSVVDDPKTYEAIPGVMVVSFTIPAAPDAVAANSGLLDGLIVDTGDGRRQPAGAPLILRRSPNQTTLRVQVLERTSPTRPVATVSVPLVIPSPPTQTTVSTSQVAMPAVVNAGGVQVIEGNATGNASQMAVAVDGNPMRIVAAKPGQMFWRVPATLAPGPHEVTFTEPGKPLMIMPVHVIGLAMSADKTDLMRGQSTKFHIAISGLDGMPKASWSAGAPSSLLVDLGGLLLRAPGFTPPKATDQGVVLLVIENRSPSVVRMGKGGDRIVVQIHQKDAGKGPFTYEDKLQSLQAGPFDIRATVVGFVRPIAAQPKS